MKLNRVLLESAGEMREWNSDESHMFFRDGTALPFQFETLIELGAVAIAIPDHDIHRQFVKKLPRAFQRRVEFVRTEQAEQKSLAILSPIIQEFGLVG